MRPVRERPVKGMSRACTALAFMLVIFSGALAAAQTPPARPEGTAQAVPEDPLGRSTPFGAVTGFVRAAEREDFARAAEYLDTRQAGAAAEALARQLFIIMDRALIADLDRISRSPVGSLQDGLPVARERVGLVETSSGGLELLVERTERPGQAAVWLFASETLTRVPEVAEELDTFDLADYMPRPLVEITWLSQPLYRWILTPLFLALAWFMGSVLTRAAVPLLRPLLRRLTGEEDDRATASLAAPIRLLLVAIAIRAFSTISTSLQTRQFWTRVAVAVAIVSFAWLLIRFSAMVSTLTSRRLLQRRLFGRVAILGLAGRLFRALVVVFAGLALLYRAGVDLTAILTGLGIGGLGLALAAQKTLENLFGGIMIITDEPIRVGDFCRVGDKMGTVEDIGIRSTRIRTLQRTVVAIPNGQLATIDVENFSQRDKFWLRHAVGVRYETSTDQMRHLLAGVRAMLYAHPKVERDGARIRFVGFGGSSLDLEIFAYVYAADFAEFLAIQEDVLLRVMDLIAESGTSIAFPSQTTYLARDTALDAERTKEAESQVREWRDRGDLPFPDFRPDQVGRPSDAVQYPPAGSALATDRPAP